jgi:hypothetical protein
LSTEFRLRGVDVVEREITNSFVPIGLLVVLYAVSSLALPAAEDAMYDRAVDLGWIDE